jgi:C1A family cysteine protease
MKIAFLFLLVSFAFVANQQLNSKDNDDEEFRNYKKMQKKSYLNKTEETKRKNAFKKCRDIVKKHNEAYANGLVTYRLKKNHFCDRFKNELQKLSIGNVLPPFEFSEKQVRGKAVGIVSNTLFPPGPPSFDWMGSNCITPVKDIGFYCNSCWAFTAIAALEAHWCLKTGNLISMSEQQLIDCNRNDRTGNFGCNGGSQASAYMYIYGNDGIQSESTYPYQEGVEHSGIYPCRYNRSNRVAKASGYWRLRPLNETLLKNVIAAKGPVAAAMYGSMESFYFYWNGIYDDPKCLTGTTHAVLIVGYGTENGIVSYLLWLQIKSEIFYMTFAALFAKIYFINNFR